MVKKEKCRSRLTWIQQRKKKNPKKTAEAPKYDHFITLPLGSTQGPNDYDRLFAALSETKQHSNCTISSPSSCTRSVINNLITRPTSCLRRGLIIRLADKFYAQCFFFSSSDPLQMLCDAYKTAPSKFAVFPIDTPTHLIDASLRHRSQSIALDFVSLYQYGRSHPPPASLSLFSLRC